MNEPIAVTGVGITHFGKQPSETVASLAARAATSAIVDAGIAPADIDVVVFANSTQGAMDGQHGIRGQLPSPASISGSSRSSTSRTRAAAPRRHSRSPPPTCGPAWHGTPSSWAPRS